MLYSDNLLTTTLHKQNSGSILREKNHGKSKLSEAILTWHNLCQHLPLANAVHQSLCSVSWGYWHVSATLKPHSKMITSYSSLQPKDEIATLSKIPNMNSLTLWLFTESFLDTSDHTSSTRNVVTMLGVETSDVFLSSCWPFSVPLDTPSTATLYSFAAHSYLKM